MAEDFFKRFDLEMQRQHAESYARKIVAASSRAAPASGVQSRSIPFWYWGGGAVVAIALMAWLIR
jgi:uncharacterized protein